MLEKMLEECHNVGKNVGKIKSRKSASIRYFTWKFPQKWKFPWKLSRNKENFHVNKESLNATFNFKIGR